MVFFENPKYALKLRSKKILTILLSKILLILSYVKVKTNTTHQASLEAAKVHSKNELVQVFSSECVTEKQFSYF